MRLGRLASTMLLSAKATTIFDFESISLSPAEWSQTILPNLFDLDKGVYLKIKPPPFDFKLVMERVKKP